MSQLIVCMVREDGDYETVAAIQNEEGIPAIEWALQIREHMTEINEGCEYVILNMEELIDVIDGEAGEKWDVTEECEFAFIEGGTFIP